MRKLTATLCLITAVLLGSGKFQVYAQNYEEQLLSMRACQQSLNNLNCRLDILDPDIVKVLRQLHSLRSSTSTTKGTGYGVGNNYFIETSHNDELFIINGEKFEAKTYCFGMEEGDPIKFLEGCALGVCVSAEILNLRSGNKCRVWCE